MGTNPRRAKRPESPPPHANPGKTPVATAPETRKSALHSLFRSISTVCCTCFTTVTYFGCGGGDVGAGGGGGGGGGGTAPSGSMVTARTNASASSIARHDASL